MKKLIIILMFYSLNNLSSQEIIKDTLLLTKLPYLVNRGILKDGDNYYLSAASSIKVDSLIVTDGAISVIKTDKNFNILWERTSRYPRMSAYPWLLYLDSNYNIHCLSKLNNLIDHLYLEIYTPEGDTIYKPDSLLYKNPSENSSGEVFHNFDNSWYYINRGNPFSTMLIKLSVYDSFCKFQERINLVEYDTSLYNDYIIHKVKQTKDSGFVISGNYNKSGKHNSSFLQKFDKDKKLEWSNIRLNDSILHFGFEVIEASNGDYLISGKCRPIPKVINGYVTYIDSSGSFLSRFNSKGEFLWEKNHTKIPSINGTKLTETPNGDIFFSANTYQSSDSLGSAFYNFTLMKLNKEGEIIWQKTWGKDSVLNEISKITLLDNNKILISGRQDIYTYLAIIKDNSNSVSDKNCNNNKIRVYPSPFSNNFNIEFHPEKPTEILLEMFDIFGRKVYTKKLGYLENVKNIISVEPDSRLADGLYVVKMSSNGFTKCIKIIKSE